MAAGAATIDMTSLLLNAVAVTFSTLKPRGILVTALTGNGANVTVAKGASNGYDGMGSAFSVTLEPGQSFMFDFAALFFQAEGGIRALYVTGVQTCALPISSPARSSRSSPSRSRCWSPSSRSG